MDFLDTNRLSPSLGLKSGRETPRWLLDLKATTGEKCGRGNEVNLIQSNNKTSSKEEFQRPVSDSCYSSKPEWFEELTQRRRHSDESVAPLLDIVSKIRTKKVEEEKKNDMAKKEQSLVGRRRQVLPSLTITDVERLKLSMKPILDFRRESVSLGPHFEIPELPTGSKLVIELLSNWGDEETIGLNGIEIFDTTRGRIQNFKKLSIKSGLDIVAENEQSKEAMKLFKEPFRTHDDNFIWTCNWLPHAIPSTAPTIKIEITFDTMVKLALLRFWNYNKSRIYSCRGVKDVSMTLDGVVIFKGEVAKATGDLRCSPEFLGDTILFTRNEEILEQVAQSDVSFQELLKDLN